MATDLKHTLSLPKTDFPMRGDLPKREPLRLAAWEKLKLYDAVQRKRADQAAFVLHDGPPFTNGDVHIGTALNKSLKDITLRYKSLRGFRTPYVPGWDCHGLPIEQKVAKEIQASGQTLSTAELRAREYETEKARYDSGLSTFRRVQETQDDLDQSRLAELQAKVNLRVAQANLDRLEGTAADRYRLTLLP